MNKILHYSFIKTKLIFILFILLSVINCLIYVFRNKFVYIPSTTYQELYSPCTKNCLKKWKQTITGYPSVEINRARQLADSIIGQSPKNTIDKILILSGFLYKKFNKQISSPDKNILTGSPLNQYYILCNNSSVQLWCGNFAAIFSSLCWAENIPCRTIEIMNPGNHHVLNECYIKEDKKWVMVDITNNQLLSMNAEKKYLNLLDFKKLLESSLPIQIIKQYGAVMQTDTITTHSTYLEKYYKKQNAIYYYYNTDFSNIDDTGNKFKRYVWPVSWYLINMEATADNTPFHVKQGLLLAWLISGIILVIKKSRK